MPERESVQCSVCNRILWVEDGPICPDCIKLPKPKQPPLSAPEAAS